MNMQPRILPDLTQAKPAKPSYDDLMRMVLELKAQVDAKPRQRISFKVTDKGCCSVYHGSRFPVTLYRQQWLNILDHIDELRAFLEANADKLPLKGE